MTLKLSDIKPHDKVRLKDVSKIQCKLLLLNYPHLNEFEVLDIRESNDGEKIVTLILDKREDGSHSVLPVLESELEYLELV